MKNATIQLIIIATLFGACSAKGQSNSNEGQIQVSPRGDSVLTWTVDGQSVRIVLSTDQIEIGSSHPSPMDRKTNCLYTRHPCSQVSNIAIWVGGRRLFVYRSVFADCTDLYTMWITRTGKLFVLALGGGDGAESYTVKIYFDSRRITKRELYADETDSLAQTTTYMPPAKVN